MRLRGLAALVAALVVGGFAALPLALRAQAPAGDPPAVLQRRRGRWLALALLILVLVGSALASTTRPLHAQPNTNSTGSGRTAWVADSEGLVKVDAATGSVLLEIEVPESQGVLRVAIDDERRVVWAATNQVLRAYDFAGTLLRTIQAPFSSSGTNSLAVNPVDGSVWFSTNSQLRHLDAAGQPLLTVALAETVRALAVDGQSGDVWVGFSKRVRRYNAAGQVIRTIELGVASNVYVDDLDLEPDSGQLWVALSNEVRRYGSVGVLEVSASLPSSYRSVARDGSGGVWVAGRWGDLFRIGATGQRLVEIVPWPRPAGWQKAYLITGLTADPTEASAWVGSTRQGQLVDSLIGPSDLDRIDPSGQFQAHVALSGVRIVQDLAFAVVGSPPSLTFTAPAAGTAVGSATPSLEVTYTSGGAAIDPASLTFAENGQPLTVTCTHTDTGATCTPSSALADGAHTISATVADVGGRRSAPAEVTFTVDTVAPTVTLSAPPDGLVTNQAEQVVEGEVSEPATLFVKRNGEVVESFPVPSAAAFATGPVPLTEGSNQLEVRALDRAANPGQASRSVTLDTAPPAAVVVGNLTVSAPEEGQATVTGAAGSVEAGARVTITNLRTLVSVTVVAGANGSFVATLAAQAGDQFRITVGDAAGNASEPVEATVPTGLPPDPATVAPPVDATVATDLRTATAFLYSGASPIQTGVDPNAIVATRAAVIRGRVLTRDATPLPGVTVQILGHPEFGQTVTRADGAFDLAVNGGGPLVLSYGKSGVLPSHRQVQVPWR